MKNIFTIHPHAINETYFQHLKCALRFGILLIVAGVACSIHAIFPFFFEKTASNLLIELTENFIARSPKVEARFLKIADLINKKR